MMHGRGKSDFAIVAEKPANKAEQSAAEPVEPRAKGECGPARHVPDAAPDTRVTRAGTHTASRKACLSEPEVGAVCGKAARTDLGGAQQ
jgi:hypothetical protein